MRIALLLAAGLGRARALAEDPAPDEVQTRVIPLPLASTLPNEGNTFGAMPVLLRVDKETGRTASIIAPSVSWNSTVRVTGTLRLFAYPSPARSITFIASGSTHVNRRLFFGYADLPVARGALTTEIEARAERNIFRRFFGIGPDTRSSDESSATRRTRLASAREGVNLPGRLNLGLLVLLRDDELEREGVPGLPLTQDLFPSSPGIGGATILAHGASLRYDGRRGGDAAEEGLASELGGRFAWGVRGASRFTGIAWDTRALWREGGRAQGAARFYLARESGDRIPFYDQCALGGESFLRGFTEGRFVDKGAWEADFEQRVRVLETRIYGVTTDWRADPFVAFGQVFDRPGDAVAHVRVSGGLGLRAWVRPNVLGRIDLAYAGEGLAVYVVLGYPW